MATSLVKARTHISFEWKTKVFLHISLQLNQQLHLACSTTCNSAKTWAGDTGTLGLGGGRPASTGAAGAPPSSHRVSPQWHWGILRERDCQGVERQPRAQGQVRLTCDPGSLFGGGQSPLGLCLGTGLGGREKAQAQMHGLPCCKNTIYNRESKPKMFASVITTRKINAYRKSSAN